MALDEQRDNDNRFEVDGFTFVINEDFLQKAQPIKVDYTTFGFKLDSGYDFSSSKSACTGCGSTCG